jgi:superfamily I DNA/RNA helicase
MTKLRMPSTTAVQLDWSDDQNVIFDWFTNGKGNLVVRARAGCAKTTTIIEGINRAPERSVLLAAFNKRIAEELNMRIMNPRAEARTLHSLGCRICMRNLQVAAIDSGHVRAAQLTDMALRLVAERAAERGAEFIKPARDVVYGITQLHSLIRSIVGDPLVKWKGAPGGTVLDKAVAFAEEHGIEESETQLYWNMERIAEAAIDATQAAKLPTNLIDFADMVYLPVACGWAKPVYDLLVVDEAQDMNPVQIDLALAVSAGRICVVGDDRQAVYGFRGADTGSLDRLKVVLNAKEMGLKTTYRCPKSVVKLASVFVADFYAADTAPAGEVRIASLVQLIDAVKPGDFVLSRTNAALVAVWFDLVRAGRPAYISGVEYGAQLTKRLRKLKAKDMPDLEHKLTQWHEGQKAKAAALANAEARQARLQRAQTQVDLLHAFMAGAESFAKLEGYIERCFRVPGGDVVQCLTVHKAKGLEAKRVFLLWDTLRTWPEAGIEEHNIAYVGITRAKETLWCCTNVAADDEGLIAEIEHSVQLHLKYE